MRRSHFLLSITLFASQGSVASGCAGTDRSPLSVRTSLASHSVGVRIDAGAELHIDEYPYDAAMPMDRRYFRALVRRVFHGCNELEKYEDIIVSVPNSATDVIGDDGVLAYDVLFGSVSSKTFPIQGTMQMLDLAGGCHAYTMADLPKEDRGFLRDQSAKCVDAVGYPALRGGGSFHNVR